MTSFKTISYREAIARVLYELMEEDERVIVIGQGVTDFKALFGTTQEIKEAFPQRVIDTPIAEDSTAGICVGLALNGCIPINTHIRADFALLAFNQIINLAAKYRYMFGGLFEVPLIFRLIVGRSWGQGAQHSQSLQSLLAHIPGLTVVMPSSPASIISTYRYAVRHHPNPTIILEHRLMYDLRFDSGVESNLGIFGSSLVREGSTTTVVAVSIMVLEAIRAWEYLKDFGVSFDIIDLHSVSHPDKALVLESVMKTGRVVIADTSWCAFGIAGEVTRMVCENDPSVLIMPCISLGMKDAPCPTSKALEDDYYPGVYEIVEAVLSGLVDSRRMEIPMPERQPMTDYYKSFKGPF
uniref:alpha-ketoacid dehydrogenase subunit beta n=1 Tax=Cyanobium sp. TaxID=2164130 RepID=UPI0040483FA8